MARFYLTIICLLLLIVTSVPAQDFQSSQGADTLFAKAETLYHEDKLLESRASYEDFLRAFSTDSRAPKVVMRLGQIDYKNKSYLSALRNYQYLLDTFPHSTLTYSVKLDMGKAYFELERYSEAEKLLRETVQLNPDPIQKWKAFVYLGYIDDKRLELEKAFEKFKQIMDRSPYPEIKQEAASYIRIIVKEKLNKEQLASLAKSLGSEYPADLILEKLISIYRIERDLGNYQISLEELIFRFPSHVSREHYEKLLIQLKTDPNRVIRIGVVLPLSGKRAIVGQRVLQGIQLAFNQLSTREKSRLELVVKDSGLGREVAQVVEKLAQDPNVIGIIGPLLTEDVESVIPIIEKYQLPIFTPTASTPGLADKSPYVFRNALTKEMQASYLARYAVNELNLYRFVVVYPTAAYGETMRKVFEDEVRLFGGHIVESIPYERNQTDFRKQISQIGGMADDQLKARVQRHIKRGTQPPPLNDKGIKSRPLVEGGLYADDNVEALKVALELNYDAIFIPGSYDKVRLIVPQLAFYNIENILLMGGNGWHSRKLVDAARNYLKTVLFVDGFYADSQNERTVKFVDMFLSTFGQNPAIHSAQAYDAANIFVKFIKEGAFNRLDMLGKLRLLKDFPGVSGDTTILPSGDSLKSLVKLTVKEGDIAEQVPENPALQPVPEDETH
jgi:ABC-type branched-subunit amino acid transport system substrate-binding protein/outer membrane protein assembly factor BamD (BamD/ComL family)